MKLFQKLVCMALTATATASLSICAFAADYTFDTAADTDYYPSTSYEDTYGTAYHYGSKNLVDYQIPELPYGVLSTTQTGVMEKLRLPGLSARGCGLHGGRARHADGAALRSGKAPDVRQDHEQVVIFRKRLGS